MIKRKYTQTRNGSSVCIIQGQLYTHISLASNREKPYYRKCSFRKGKSTKQKNKWTPTQSLTQ